MFFFQKTNLDYYPFTLLPAVLTAISNFSLSAGSCNFPKSFFIKKAYHLCNISTQNQMEYNFYATMTAAINTHITLNCFFFF